MTHQRGANLTRSASATEARCGTVGSASHCGTVGVGIGRIAPAPLINRPWVVSMEYLDGR
jgi:hypothetical protein